MAMNLNLVIDLEKTEKLSFPQISQDVH